VPQSPSKPACKRWPTLPLLQVWLDNRLMSNTLEASTSTVWDWPAASTIDTVQRFIIPQADRHELFLRYQAPAAVPAQAFRLVTLSPLAFPRELHLRFSLIRHHRPFLAGKASNWPRRIDRRGQGDQFGPPALANDFIARPRSRSQLLPWGAKLLRVMRDRAADKLMHCAESLPDQRTQGGEHILRQADRDRAADGPRAGTMSFHASSSSLCAYTWSVDPEI
jgi:hypothetical protein